MPVEPILILHQIAQRAVARGHVQLRLRPRRRRRECVVDLESERVRHVPALGDHPIEELATTLVADDNDHALWLPFERRQSVARHNRPVRILCAIDARAGLVLVDVRHRAAALAWAVRRRLVEDDLRTRGVHILVLADHELVVLSLASARVVRQVRPGDVVAVLELRVPARRPPKPDGFVVEAVVEALRVRPDRDAARLPREEVADAVRVLVSKLLRDAGQVEVDQPTEHVFADRRHARHRRRLRGRRRRHWRTRRWRRRRRRRRRVRRRCGRRERRRERRWLARRAPGGGGEGGSPGGNGGIGGKPGAPAPKAGWRRRRRIGRRRAVPIQNAVADRLLARHGWRRRLRTRRRRWARQRRVRRVVDGVGRSEAGAHRTVLAKGAQLAFLYRPQRLLRHAHASRRQGKHVHGTDHATPAQRRTLRIEILRRAVRQVHV